LVSGSIAASAVASTQIGACVGGMVWLVASWIRHKPSSVALINGVIAGLAGITPAAGYIDSTSSIIIGLILGIVSFFSVILIKHKLKIDDALDVSSVHGITGIVGALAIGFCSQKRLNPKGADGLFYGNPNLLGYQALAIFVVIIYSGVFTFLIALLASKIFKGIKITTEEEEEGLDITEHKEFAYHDLLLTGYEPLYDTKETIN